MALNVGFRVPAKPLRFEHWGAHEDLSLPNHALTLTVISKLSASNPQKERHKSLYWFGPPLWCNTLLQFGVVDCLVGWGWKNTRYEQPPEERCSWARGAGVCEGSLNDPSPLWWWLVLFIEALALFPNIEQEGIQRRPFWKGTSSTSYPD